MPPILFITCGPQGSRKTTLARELERKHSALRLAADEWLHELHPGVVGTELDALRPSVEEVQWGVAARALDLGSNVVLDWGLWSQEERDHYRLQARSAGARVVLCLVDPPRDELLRRLSLRNEERPVGAFTISEAELDRALTLFERPTDEEMALFDSDPSPSQTTY